MFRCYDSVLAIALVLEVAHWGVDIQSGALQGIHVEYDAFKPFVEAPKRTGGRLSHPARTIEYMFEDVALTRGTLALSPRPLTALPAPLPEALEAVPAGFPSPAQDYWAGDLDLGDHLIRDRAATYIVRASGHSMIGAGIHDGDELIVDRGVQASHGCIVVAILDGELTVKRLATSRGHIVLRAENPNYPHIEIPELSEMTIWGVVTWVLHRT